jgi:hypothetical protein
MWQGALPISQLWSYSKAYWSPGDIVADIEEVLIAYEKMAKELRFQRSPTIRINGLDIDR